MPRRPKEIGLFTDIGEKSDEVEECEPVKKVRPRRNRLSLLRAVDVGGFSMTLAQLAKGVMKKSYRQQNVPPVSKDVREKPKKKVQKEKKNKKKTSRKALATEEQETTGTISTFMTSSVREQMAEIDRINKNEKLVVVPVIDKPKRKDDGFKFTPMKRSGKPATKKCQISSTPGILYDPNKPFGLSSEINQIPIIERIPDYGVGDIVTDVFKDGVNADIYSSPILDPAFTTPSMLKRRPAKCDGHDSVLGVPAFSASSDETADDKYPIISPPSSAHILRLRSRAIDKSQSNSLFGRSKSAPPDDVSHDSNMKTNKMEKSGVYMAEVSIKSPLNHSNQSCLISAKNQNISSSINDRRTSMISLHINDEKRISNTKADQVESPPNIFEAVNSHQTPMEVVEDSYVDKFMSANSDVDLFDPETDIPIGVTSNKSRHSGSKIASLLLDDRSQIPVRNGNSISVTPSSDEDTDDDSDHETNSTKSSKTDLSSEEIAALSSNLEGLEPFTSPAPLSRRTIVGRREVDFERVIYDKCRQNGPLPWDKAISESELKNCVKIGEGSYGEVFRTIDGNNDLVALKIIPIEGDFKVNGDYQKTFWEIWPEIYISMTLSDLRENKRNATPNFVQVKRVHCVRGKYPQKLLDEWKEFAKRKRTENDDPCIFGPEQLFIVFVFSYGGCDLEAVKLKSIAQATSIVKQVVVTLAVAETELEFEHRDLHIGNILVKETENPEIEYLIDGKPVKVESCGVHVYVIDFTLSRLIQASGGEIFYSDLAKDPALFESEGDYQYDIYRQMRDIINDNWKTFAPKTNLCWIDYLVDKLVHEKRYDGNRLKGMRIKQARSFDRLRSTLGNYDSCKQLILDNDFFSEFIS